MLKIMYNIDYPFKKSLLKIIILNNILYYFHSKYLGIIIMAVPKGRLYWGDTYIICLAFYTSPLFAVFKIPHIPRANDRNF